MENWNMTLSVQTLVTKVDIKNNIVIPWKLLSEKASKISLGRYIIYFWRTKFYKLLVEKRTPLLEKVENATKLNWYKKAIEKE